MFILMISLALSAAPAEPAASPPPTETAAKPAKPAKPKMICRRIATLGSRLAERECRTQKDWDAAAEEASERRNPTDRES